MEILDFFYEQCMVISNSFGFTSNVFFDIFTILFVVVILNTFLSFIMNSVKESIRFPLDNYEKNEKLQQRFKKCFDRVKGKNVDFIVQRKLFKYYCYYYDHDSYENRILKVIKTRDFKEVEKLKNLFIVRAVAEGI